jgi:CRISPR-associated endonuclease/helicase Cas3
VAAAARRGAAVAWIRNTVDDCLAAARLLRDAYGLDSLVFHARFAQCDRQRREQEVLQCFGKDSSRATGRARVLVATQVIEQSLDLDFDAMVSDLAPVDLLIQRAGRLWRHARGEDARPSGLACELVVLSPTPDADPPEGWLGGVFAGTAHVYKDVGVLWRTICTLNRARAIETPGALRDLIESVYDDSAADPPASLVRQVNRAEGEEAGNAAAASYGTLKVTDGYDASAHTWESELHARTRLSEDQTVVRLARVDRDGCLTPWDTMEGVAWRAWALAEVRLSSKRVPWDVGAEPKYDAAIAAVRATWGRFEQEIPVLPLLCEVGTWRGILIRRGDQRAIAVRYTDEEGLAYDRTVS